MFDHYAKYYDLFYEGKDYAAEANFVHEVITAGRPGKKTILDLGCGTGRHAIEFAKRGHDVCGVDVSLHMIEVARESLPLHYQDQVLFQHGSVQNTKLPRKYDAAVALFHVLSYQVEQQELESFLANVAQCLTATGYFIFDFWYGPAVLEELPERREKTFRSQDLQITRLIEPELHPERNTVELLIVVEVKNLNSGETKTFEERHFMRYFFEPELRTVLRDYGLEVTSITELFGGQKVNSGTWSATVVAKSGI